VRETAKHHIEETRVLLRNSGQPSSMSDEPYLFIYVLVAEPELN
jgi:hypothetical protein